MPEILIKYEHIENLFERQTDIYLILLSKQTNLYEQDEQERSWIYFFSPELVFPESFPIILVWEILICLA